MSDLIVLGRVHGAADIALLRGALEAAGNPAWLIHHEMAHNYGHASLALDGALIVAPKSRTREAAALLKDIAPITHSSVPRSKMIVLLLLWFLFGAHIGIGFNAVFLRDHRSHFAETFK